MCVCVCMEGTEDGGLHRCLKSVCVCVCECVCMCVCVYVSVRVHVCCGVSSDTSVCACAQMRQCRRCLAFRAGRFPSLPVSQADFRPMRAYLRRLRLHGDRHDVSRLGSAFSRFLQQSPIIVASHSLSLSHSLSHAKRDRDT